MALAPVAALCAPSARAATATFNFTGAQQTFTVPAGVTSVHVDAVGGRGGNGPTAAGGFGAAMSAELAVTPGEVLYILVGGNGATSGFNGGGAGGTGDAGASSAGGRGGGASDVRRISTSEPGTLASRVVVAAGGGGGGGGAGGPGGAGGGPGATCAGCGGPGGAGTQAGGGAGGSLAGAAGELRDGGAGGSSAALLSSGGGGGGGGLYGGGGGGARALNVGGGGGGGGGGGSSFAVGGETASLDATGVPKVTLSFTRPPTAPRPAYPLPGISTKPAAPAGGSARPLQLMSPFPVVRISGRVTRRGALIRLLSVRAPARTTIRVRCRGRRCPRAQAKRGRGINRPVRFRRFERTLRAGTLLEVRVSRAGVIGKFTRFRIRRGRPPARRDLCLRPGATRGSRCPDG